MRLLLRKIETPRWVTSAKHLSWLPQGQFQANALWDIRTINNQLSLYALDAEEDRERVVAAMAVAYQPDDFAYVEIDASILAKANFKLDDSEAGTTKDEIVNHKHVNIIELSGSKLLDFARIVLNSKRNDLDRDDVTNLIRESVEKGYLPAGSAPKWLGG